MVDIRKVIGGILIAAVGLYALYEITRSFCVESPGFCGTSAAIFTAATIGIIAYVKRDVWR